MHLPTYRVNRMLNEKPLTLLSDSWDNVEPIQVDNFRQESSSHRPNTEAKLVYSDFALSGLFVVEDRFVRCVHEGVNAPVYKDSCVEFFVQPNPKKGYFNFEFNCGGAMLCSYIEDCERTPEGFKKFQLIDEQHCSMVSIIHSFPKSVLVEIEAPVQWRLAFRIPFKLLEYYCGVAQPGNQNQWRANFFKCADDSSHPHWASWSKLPQKNFHMPQLFGNLLFD